MSKPDTPNLITDIAQGRATTPNLLLFTGGTPPETQPGRKNQIGKQRSLMTEGQQPGFLKVEHRKHNTRGFERRGAVPGRGT
jgi:hypothetical protein